MMMMRFSSPSVSFCEEIQVWVLSLEPGQAHCAGLFLLYARSAEEPVLLSSSLRRDSLESLTSVRFSALLQSSYYVASIIIAPVCILRCL